MIRAAGDRGGARRITHRPTQPGTFLGALPAGEVRHQSLAFDVAILIRTLAVMLRLAGR